MILDFDSEIVEWRGPAPYFYVPVPPEESAEIQTIAGEVSYGWGCIPVRVRLGRTEWTTSLFPRDGTYLVPVKAAVRKAEHVGLGDDVTLRLHIES